MSVKNSSLSVPKSVAVLRLSAIGDVVLCASMVMHLTKCSGFKVFWITTIQTKELLGEIPDVEFIIIPKPKNLRTFFECKRILKNFAFDFLLLAQASFSAHFVAICINSKLKIGFDSRRSKDLHRLFIEDRISEAEEHFVDAYFNFSAKLGLVTPDVPTWKDLFDSRLKKQVNQLNLPDNKPLLAVNPSSSKLERNWSIDSYVTVINYAQQKGLNVVLIGGNKVLEVDFSHQIISRCKNPPLDLTGKTKLCELPHLIKSCDILMAPDTGAIHIATALGVPVIGLYAVANPKLTGPYRSSQFSVDRFEVAYKKFSKSKKHNFFGRVHDRRAMALIKVEDVTAKLDQLIIHISEMGNS